MKAYKRGNVVRIKGKWTIPAGGGPDTVTVTIRDPAGVVTVKNYGVDLEVVQDGTIDYHLDLDLDLAGDYLYEIKSTGNGKALDDGVIHVEPTAIA